jgi:hypothetical protein
MEKISSTDHVRKEEVLLRVKEQRNKAKVKQSNYRPGEALEIPGV